MMTTCTFDMVIRSFSFHKLAYFNYLPTYLRHQANYIYNQENKKFDEQFHQLNPHIL